MVQLREGTQKIVNMYNDKNNCTTFYMDDLFYRNDAYVGGLGDSFDEIVETEHALDEQKFNNSQDIVNHALEFADRDDRYFIDIQLHDSGREYLTDSRATDLSEDESDVIGHLIGHIRADDDSFELDDMKHTADMIEFQGGYDKYFVSYRDLNDFDKDLKEQLSDKIADGISMNEVIENFNELSQAQETGNERVEQLELNLEGLDDEKDLFPGK